MNADQKDERSIGTRAWHWVRENGFEAGIKAAVLIFIGFMGGQAYQADELKQQAQKDHRAGIQEIGENFDKSLKPLMVTMKSSIDDVMKICKEATFRSIRAADSVKDAAESASSVFDEQKRALREELEK